MLIYNPDYAIMLYFYGMPSVLFSILHMVDIKTHFMSVENASFYGHNVNC